MFAKVVCAVLALTLQAQIHSQTQPVAKESTTATNPQTPSKLDTKKSDSPQSDQDGTTTPSTKTTGTSAVVAAPFGDCAPPKAPPRTEGFNYFKGHTRDASYVGIGGVLVRVRRTDSPSVDVQSFSDPTSDSGCYSTQLVPAGTYDVTFSKDGYTQTMPGITLRDGKEAPPAEVDMMLKPDPTVSTPILIATLLLMVGFFASILLVRWHNIAVPNREGLASRVDDLQLRLSDANAADRWKDQLNRIKVDLRTFNRRMLRDFLFWSRGQENATWATIHMAELDLLDRAPLNQDRVMARLASAQQQLAASDKPEARVMAARIRQTAECQERPSDRAYRELLSEVQFFLYKLTDTEFAQLTAWQNKAVWLTLVGLLLIVTLAVAAGHWVLFVAGGHCQGYNQ
jgi:hypothetical protein